MFMLAANNLVDQIVNIALGVIRVMLLAFGVGLGGQISALKWAGSPIDYLSYLAPGILAYTAFMTAFFQSLFSAYMRMHFQKSWEGQLTTQVRLEHVIWIDIHQAQLDGAKNLRASPGAGKVGRYF